MSDLALRREYGGDSVRAVGWQRVDSVLARYTFDILTIYLRYTYDISPLFFPCATVATSAALRGLHRARACS